MSFQLLAFFSCLFAVKASLIAPYRNIHNEYVDPANSLESCDLSSCDAYCRRAGYPLGLCLKNTCFCIQPHEMVAANTEQGALDKSSSLKSCDALTCNSVCKQHGYPYGGICYNGGCYCIKADGDSFKFLTLPGALDKSSSLKSCDALTCNSACKQHGYPYGGICLNGGCYCIKTEGDSLQLVSQPEELDSSNSLEMCFDTSCDSMCRSHGYPRGVCIYNKCYCVRPSETVLALKNIQELTDSLKNEELNTNMLDTNCQDEECDQLCNMSGVNGGVCVHGQCTCSRVKGRNMIGMLSPQPCNILTCMRSCVALNYATGMCESITGCRCY